MSNYYHLLLETPRLMPSRGTRDVNGVRTNAFNHRHAHVGHVLQSRYKLILAHEGIHFLELPRSMVFNPVEAWLVAALSDRPWSR